MTSMQLRSTRQRQIISQTLEQKTGFISAQELHKQIIEAGESIGLATVYRALQSMAEVGGVDVVRNLAGEMLFRACDSKSHHHHLVCQKCGLAIELESGAMETWADSLAAKYGFSQTSHQIEVFGVCPSCSAA